MTKLPTSTQVQLTYISDGDPNGLFYYLGTSGKTKAWSNPHTSGLIQISQSSVWNQYNDNPQNLVDRQLNGNICTADFANSFFKIDLKQNNFLLKGYWRSFTKTPLCSR